jgi:hypothetical protein
MNIIQNTITGKSLIILLFGARIVRDEFYSLVKKGAGPAIEPFKEGRYELAFVKDPDGIWIELLGFAKQARKK